MDPAAQPVRPGPPGRPPSRRQPASRRRASSSTAWTSSTRRWSTSPRPTSPTRRSDRLRRGCRQAVAARLGLTLEISNTAFDALIPDLAAGRCDIVWTGLYVSESASQVADAVPYMATGQVVHGARRAIPKGIPASTTCAARPSPSRAAAWSRTHPPRRVEECTEAGQPAINIQGYPRSRTSSSRSCSAASTRSGRPRRVLNWMISNPDQYEVAYKRVPRTNYGVYYTKGNTELGDALAAAIAGPQGRWHPGRDRDRSTTWTRPTARRRSSSRTRSEDAMDRPDLPLVADLDLALLQGAAITIALTVVSFTAASHRAGGRAGAGQPVARRARGSPGPTSGSSAPSRRWSSCCSSGSRCRSSSRPSARSWFSPFMAARSRCPSTRAPTPPRSSAVACWPSTTASGWRRGRWACRPASGFRRVIAPQLIRVDHPAMANDFITMLKITSLA